MFIPGIVSSRRLLTLTSPVTFFFRSLLINTNLPDFCCNQVSVLANLVSHCWGNQVPRMRKNNKGVVHVEKQCALVGLFLGEVCSATFIFHPPPPFQYLAIIVTSLWWYYFFSSSSFFFFNGGREGYGPL